MISEHLRYVRPIVVHITGGLGTQLLGLAYYKYLLECGHNVYADLSYFTHNLGWTFLLHRFGYPASYFRLDPRSGIIKHYIRRSKIDPAASLFRLLYLTSRILFDFKDELCPVRLATSLRYLPSLTLAISDEDKSAVNSCFSKLGLSTSPFILVHHRVGDYVDSGVHSVLNLSSIVSSIERLPFAPSYPVLWSSDSELDLQYISNLSPHRTHIVLHERDPIIVHSIFSRASFTFCANSTFSLTSAVLSNSPFIVPRRWFSDSAPLSMLQLEQAISSSCSHSLYLCTSISFYSFVLPFLKPVSCRVFAVFRFHI